MRNFEVTRGKKLRVHGGDALEFAPSIDGIQKRKRKNHRGEVPSRYLSGAEVLGVSEK